MFEELKVKREQEWESHISDEIRKLRDELRSTGRRLTLQEYKQLRLNSWERWDLLLLLDDQALLSQMAHYRDNSARPHYTPPYSTYDEVLMHHMLPELMRRMQAQTKTPNR